MLNFKHLYYFWATAKAGGLVRAGAQLHTTPQTLSTQIKLLEDRLGCELFRKSGRRLELTEDGRVALGVCGADLLAGCRTGGGHRPLPQRRQAA